MAAIAFSRSIGPVPIDCIVSEKHTTELMITEIPIETGSVISDHAVVMPKKVSLDIGSGSAVASFAALVALQESRAPFTLVTGLKVYRNMLIKSINPTRDVQFGHVLRANVDLQEIILVSTAQAAGTSGNKPGQPGGAGSTKAANPGANPASGVAGQTSPTVNSGTTGLNPASPADSSILFNTLGN